MQPLLGTGIDIVEIERVEAGLARHGQRFLDRLFTEKEQAYCEADATFARHAGRFAAKEAVAKALGVGIGESLGWKDIEIANDARGMPYVQLSDAAMKTFDNPTLLVSISHCKAYATAMAIRSK